MTINDMLEQGVCFQGDHVRVRAIENEEFSDLPFGTDYKDDVSLSKLDVEHEYRDKWHVKYIYPLGRDLVIEVEDPDAE